MEEVPEWANYRCSCGGYYEDDLGFREIEFKDGHSEEVCEPCQDAIAACNL